ncbi:putative leucine-rich repeat-containing, plant-type, leucine-rich repeat domain, L [Medicago truncatula]|uniref:LRR receptor-like kinase family protein n=1 Tax=Medicago truncatula TaxID=3880 RepID=G7L671_MEDTR|nr:receptor-like protein EIX2 [Medicago truncatula]AES77699.1 LRR receptor-like kinase family protein [Medicago truncatula]RHN44431.1 putative leucine-rich repeat-containing, plant-type, leucine-rich repeat domain, L [Medicago truncatula]
MAVQYVTQALVLIFSIITTLNFIVCMEVTCNDKERNALLRFKHGLSDPSKSLSSWSAADDCCRWMGVRCNNMTGRVMELDLTPLDFEYMELSGEISPSLLELKYLIRLDLSLNYFVHTKIPSFFGSMERLTYLDLSYSGFMGLIPHQLGNLSNLKYLNLGYNYALQIDNLDWITKLPSLEHLDLSGVDLYNETNWFELLSNSLPSLLKLHLENCQLDNIEATRKTNFTNLQVLDLSNNNLNHEILSWFSNLSTTLVQLDLSSNILQGEIPQIISNLQNLKTLELQGNQLSGALPDSLGRLKHLEVLDLSKNTIVHSIPTSFSNLSSLRTLNLGHNQLNGTIPKSLGFLRNLQVLNLGANSLTGGIPATLGILSNLVTLDLSFNLLEGPVHGKSLEKLSKLKELRLSSTNVFLNVDSSWTPLFQLEYVLLSSCGIGPKFPSWLKMQSSVKVLTMSNSGISDLAPSWFWNWILQIEFLDISNNFISGDISNIYLNSSIINLSSNHFKGRLPSVSANVEVLNIANNSISGPISSPFLCERLNFENKLTVLDVSNNLLSGNLGHCWIHWQNLMHLNLGRNNLSGEIPNSIGFLSELESLLLDDNDFYGSIPSTLQNCSMLKFIDLGNNKLSDTLPSWIWEMQYLMVLRLRSNEFKGSITQKMCQLSSLIVLDIANNSLSGTIPNCLNEMKTMAGEDDFFANPLKYNYGFGFNYNNYKESLVLVPKGDELEYRDNLILVRMIDLSSNNLFGTIPPQIAKLSALRFLNLSQNSLYGEIPNDMGKMKLLESLDLSLNKISGQIPQSMSDLSFLSFLNLSNNNLSGRIPTSTQLQSFEALNYAGNPQLCGPPVMNNCTKMKQVLERGNSDAGFVDTSDFYVGMGVGFAAGFWGVCIAIFFNRTCRHAYFHFLDRLKDLVYETFVLKVRRTIAVF